jgi:hypothetical protein
VEILASKVDEGPKKVKGVLHWVSSSSPSVTPRKATLRMCAPLLLHTCSMIKTALILPRLFAQV